jgi:hypothetical protein
VYRRHHPHQAAEHLGGSKPMNKFMTLAAAILSLICSTAQAAQSFELPTFDSAAGTLTKADLLLEASAISGPIFSYAPMGDAFPMPFDASGTVTVTFDAQTLGIDLGDPMVTVSLVYFDNRTFAPNETFSLADDPKTGETSVQIEITDPAALAALSTVGDDTFEVSCQSLVTIEAGDLSVGAENTTFDCGGSIEYTSSSDPMEPPSVPAPPPLALIALGLLGWRMLRR